MDDNGWYVEVPNTARAWASGAEENLAAVLRDELEQQSDSLTQDCCESGGWPDDILIEVSELAVTKHTLIAEIAIAFNEMVPSSCRDVSFAEKRRRWLTLRLSPNSTDAEIEFPESDSHNRDVADRNSAADGE